MLRRSSSSATDWQVIVEQGGGINACADGLAKAPRTVVADLVLAGADADGNEVANCGSAPALARTLVQSGTGQYRPLTFCPSNHTCFTDAHWTSWGQVAVAHAVAHYSPPGGTPTTYAATVTLSEIRTMCGGTRYTRATWSQGDTTFMPVGTCGSWSGG